METDPFKWCDRSCPQKILFAVCSRFLLLIAPFSIRGFERVMGKKMINFMRYGISLRLTLS